MMRMLKGLGTALTAVVALGAVAVGAAQATPTIEVSEPAIVEATQSETLVFASGSRTIECASSLLYDALAGSTSELTVAPRYANCSTNIGGSKLLSTFTVNHCEYTFHNMEKAGSSWTALMDILCENPGEEMEIHVYENESTHKLGKSLCTYKIPPQKSIGTVVFSNMLESKPVDVTINMTLSKMQFNVTEGIKLLCGSSNGNATYTGLFTMHAESIEGLPIPVGVNGE